MESSTSPINVGILHSLTGVTAISESSLADAALLAVMELDEQGGLLGRPIRAIQRDGGSNPAQFVDQAEELLATHDVCVIFGCWSSASRKAVKPVIARHDSLLFYPMQYEGLEQSEHVIYMGSTLNQQFEPAVEWAMAKNKRSCVIVGSDYVYPRTANVLVRALFESGGGCVLDEIYVPLESMDFSAVATSIQERRPDIVFNTLAGEGNLHFFRELARANVDSRSCPVLSFSITEVELQQMKADVEGHYACWSYFQSLRTEENSRFLHRFHRVFGSHRVASDPAATSYAQVHTWADMVRRAKSEAAADVRQCVRGAAFLGPFGWVEVQDNHHVKRRARIGRADSKGEFEIVWQSREPILPRPWLGVEDLKDGRAHLIRRALESYTDAIHLNWKFEEEIVKRRYAEQALERRRQVAVALRDTLAMVNSDHPLSDLLDYIVMQARHLLNADAGILYKLDDSTTPSVLRAASSLEPGTLLPNHVVVGEDPVSQSVLNGHAVAVSDLEDWSASAGEETVDSSLSPVRGGDSHQAVLSTPLLIRKTTWGALVFAYRQCRTFTEQDVRVAESLGDHAALAIENERLRERAEQSAATAERSRLARDLHDSVSQALFAASMTAEAVARQWTPPAPDLADLLTDVQRLTRGALAEMRALLLEMRPMELDRLPLRAVFDHLVDAARGRSRLDIHLTTIGDCDVPPEVKSGLYRVAQEALNNVVRHADAQNAWVHLDCRQSKVILLISDDGKGFETLRSLPTPTTCRGTYTVEQDGMPDRQGVLFATEKTRRPLHTGMAMDHMGLAMMRERAEAIGAKLDIESAADRGTMVRIEWAT